MRELLSNPFSRLFLRFFWKPRAGMLQLLLVAALAGLDIVSPLLIMRAVDVMVAGAGGVLPEAARNAAFREILVLAGAMVTLVLVQYGVRVVLSRVQNRLVFDGTAQLRNQLYDQLQAQSLNFHAERRVGELLTHLVSDVQVLQDAVLEILSDAPFNAVMLAGLVVAMCLLDPLLAVVVVGFLALVLVGAFLAGRGGLVEQAHAMEQSADLTGKMQETLSGLRTLKILGASAGEGRGVAAASKLQAEGLTRAAAARAAISPLFGLAEYVGILIVVVLGGWSSLHGHITAGGLVAFFAYMEMAAEPMERGARVYSKWQMALVAARRLASVLLDTERGAAPQGTIVPARISGGVHLAGVSFSYPHVVRPALERIEFSVLPGETVAIVGPNAAGKSTLLDMLLKLQQPTDGVITIDDLDLNDIQTDAWRNLIGVVPQEVFLLNRSIAENIALGTENLEHVEQAAKLAGFHDWILQLPHGYETVPGERGATLSGGERQRIAIARLFLRDPRIVVLDEPTSALDARAEADLIPALERLCQGRTTFIVSHRPALLKRADKILLLSQGKQLSFWTPERVWSDFPEYRDLFPDSWQSAVQMELQQ